MFSPNLSGCFFYVWLCVNGTNRTYGNDNFDHPSIHPFKSDKLLPFDSTVVVILFFGYFFQWTFGRWALFSRYYAVLIKKDITTMMTTWHLYTLDGTKQIWIKTMDWRTTIFFSLSPFPNRTWNTYTYYSNINQYFGFVIFVWVLYSFFVTESTTLLCLRTFWVLSVLNCLNELENFPVIR